MKRIAFILVIFQASMLMAATPRDAVVDISVHIAVDAKGRVVRRVRITRTINTAWAVDKLSDPKIRFDATRQALKILEAKTITSDNRVIPARKAARNLSTLPKLAKAPDLALHREMVVTMLGIEKGCRTVLEYEVRDLKPLPFGRVWRFDLPVHQFIRHFSVTVDSRTPVDWVMLNPLPGMKPKVIKKNGLSLTWSVHGPINALAPTLVIYRSDDPVRFMTGLDSQTGKCPLLGKVIAKALKKQGTARFAAVLDAVKAAIRVLPLKKGLFADNPRGFCDVLKQGYATPLEAAMVLKKAMNDAGFHAGLEFYGPKNSRPARVNTLWTMTTVGVRVGRVSDLPFLVELPEFIVSDERVAISGRNYLFLNRNPHVVTGPVTGCTKGMTRKVIANLRLNAKAVYSGSVNIILRRDAPAFLSLAKDPKAWAKTVAGQVLPNSKVKGYRVLNLSSGLVSVSIRVKGRLVRSGPDILLALPQVARQFEPVLSKPAGPFRKPGILCNSLDFRLTLPRAWKSVVSADAIEEACKSGRFKYMTRQKNRVLHVKASFRLAGPYISRAQAGLLQPVVRAAMAPALWRVLLVPGK